MGYKILEPFGSDIDDYRAGVASADFYNAHRNAETTPPVSPLDRFPWRLDLDGPDEEHQETDEERAEKIRLFLNGKANKGEADG